MFLCSYGRSCSLSPVDVGAGFKPAIQREIARSRFVGARHCLARFRHAPCGCVGDAMRRPYEATTATGSWGRGIASPTLAMPLVDAWADAVRRPYEAKSWKKRVSTRTR